MHDEGDRGGTHLAALGGPGVMILSALLFGYFGFIGGGNWQTPGVDGQPVFFRLLAGWTLQGSAIAFVIAAVLTIANRFFGNVLYAVVGLLGAIGLVIVVVLDVADKQHGLFANSTIILLLFAAWNGYGSFQSLRMLMALRSMTR